VSRCLGGGIETEAGLDEGERGFESRSNERISDIALPGATALLFACLKKIAQRFLPLTLLEPSHILLLGWRPDLTHSRKI
jgi:hypothetical protein